MRIMKKAFGRGLADLILIGIILGSIFPFLYMFLMSFRSTINAYDFSFSLDKFTLQQYIKIFQMDYSSIMC